MQLQSFPMDRQSCPLILGSCEYIYIFFLYIMLCINLLQYIHLKLKSLIPWYSAIHRLDLTTCKCSCRDTL
jgi:hypothetical protein